MCGWHGVMDNGLHSYFSRRQEITVHQGCLLWGFRVIILEPLRKGILSTIHEGNIGAIARNMSGGLELMQT